MEQRKFGQAVGLLEQRVLPVNTSGEHHPDVHDCLQAIAEHYTGWDQAEPRNGYDEPASLWQAELDAV